MLLVMYGGGLESSSWDSIMGAGEEDKRQSPRRRTLKAAIIVFNDRHCSLPCAVRDLSETGARLTIDGSVTIPDNFELIVELDGLAVDCRVVRRKAHEIAVMFVSAPRKVAPRRAQVVNPLAPVQAPSLRRKSKLT